MCLYSSELNIIAFGLLFLALPVHLLIVKILCVDAQLVLPRHKIMLSLTVSDALQILIVSIYFVMKQPLLTAIKNDTICSITENTMLFFGILTLVASSCSIATLSIERYISCIHSFYVHQIMTTKRVVALVIAQWCVAIFLGFLAISIELGVQTKRRISESPVIQLATIGIVIPASVVISVIQIHLFRFSRSKLVRVKPDRVFGNQAEFVDYRKTQLKITLVASMVAIAYVSCMLPMAILFIAELKHGLVHSPASNVIKALALLNTLADPLIYGIGITDTRRLIWKDIKRGKSFILRYVSCFLGLDR